MPEAAQRTWVLLAMSVAAWALLPAGCASRGERVCDVMCDCAGCSEAGYADCVEEASRAEDTAGDLGCVDSFDTYLACLEDEIECRDEQFSYDGCELEEEELRACGVTVFRSVCELANDFQSKCGFPPQFPGDSSECTAQLQCLAACNLESSCEGLTGQNLLENRRLAECQSRC